MTRRVPDAQAPRAIACVFSPDGHQIAYVRPVPAAGKLYNQVFVAELRDFDVLQPSRD